MSLEVTFESLQAFRFTRARRGRLPRVTSMTLFALSHRGSIKRSWGRNSRHRDVANGRCSAVALKQSDTSDRRSFGRTLVNCHAVGVLTESRAWTAETELLGNIARITLSKYEISELFEEHGRPTSELCSSARSRKQSCKVQEEVNQWLLREPRTTQDGRIGEVA